MCSVCVGSNGPVCGSGSQEEPAAPAVQEALAQEQDEKQAPEEAQNADGPAGSVLEGLSPDEAAAAAPESASPQDAAQQSSHSGPDAKDCENVGADEQPPVCSAAGAADDTLGDCALFPRWKVTRARSQTTRCASGVSGGSTSHGTAARAMADGPEGSGAEDATAAVHGGEVPATASSCDQEGGASSRQTRSGRRTAAPKAAKVDSEAGPARRTRARSSTSVASEPAEAPSVPVAPVPRKQRNRRGRNEDGDISVSAGPASSSEGPVLRRRTRASSAVTVASTSVDTGGASDCENRATDNLATSQVRPAEEDECSPAKFVAILSPIPEEVVANVAKGANDERKTLQIASCRNTVMTQFFMQGSQGRNERGQ